MAFDTDIAAGAHKKSPIAIRTSALAVILRAFVAHLARRISGPFSDHSLALAESSKRRMTNIFEATDSSTMLPQLRHLDSTKRP
jgi:hypothetical protein